MEVTVGAMEVRARAVVMLVVAMVVEEMVVV